MATEKSNIYSAIPKIMNEVGVIGKDKKNQQQGFMYRGIDDVMNALSPAMTKHGVFVVPEVLEDARSERPTKSGGVNFIVYLKIRYTFFAEDGSSVSAVTVGEAMDTADKGSNKAMAIAFKYACFQVFCIPTEEMQDPDAHAPEPSKPKSQPEDSPKQEKKPDEKTALMLKIRSLIYPSYKSKDEPGEADPVIKAIYDQELKAHMSLNKDIKKYSDLNLNQLKDMLQKMDLPEVLR